MIVEERETGEEREGRSVSSAWTIWVVVSVVCGSGEIYSGGAVLLVKVSWKDRREFWKGF